MIFVAGNQQQAWQQATDKYYGPAEDIDDLLKASDQLLHNLVFKHEGADVCGERLARVKALLGAPTEDIEAVFNYTLEKCEGKNKAFIYERFGRYYESVNDESKALEQYTNATGYYDENGGPIEPWFARKRQRVLTHLSQTSTFDARYHGYATGPQYQRGPSCHLYQRGPRYPEYHGGTGHPGNQGGAENPGYHGGAGNPGYHGRTGHPGYH